METFIKRQNIQYFMETTQKVGADFRVTIPSTIRKVMHISIDDVVVIDIKDVIRPEGKNE